MKVREVYQDHDKRTIDYMEFVVEQIKKDYSVVPSSWRISLDLIADTLDIYFKAIDDINKYGIFKIDDKQRMSKNGAVAIQNVCLQNISKLLSNFGLTPMSKSKMKNLDGLEDDTLENLMNC